MRSKRGGRACRTTVSPTTPSLGSQAWRASCSRCLSMLSVQTIIWQHRKRPDPWGSELKSRVKGLRGGPVLGVLAALAEDLSLIPSTHVCWLTTAYTYSSGEMQDFWPPQAPDICTQTHRQLKIMKHTYLKIMKINLKK